MLKKDYELTHVSDQLARATDAKLARARQLELKENELGDMRAELKRLQDENKSLSERVIVLTEQLSTAKTEVVNVKSKASEDEHVSSEDKTDEPLSDDDSTQQQYPKKLQVRTPRHPAKQLHPPEFKVAVK